MGSIQYHPPRREELLSILGGGWCWTESFFSTTKNDHMAEHTLPDAITAKIDKIINEDFLDNVEWDELASNVVQLLKSNSKLVDLLKTMYDLIQLEWPSDADA